jgi:hypothetical protein
MERDSSMPMITLVYVSFATNPMPDDELHDLLKIARENNKALDVTGMLLYRDGFFIQALEGEQDTVTSLYEKIKTDPRHRNVLQVYRQNIKKRSFEEWSMGFNKLESGSLEELEGYTDFLKHPSTNFFAQHPGHARTLLDMFRNKSYF